MITDEILNITIFNIFVDNSICEVKLKFNGLGIWALFTNRITNEILNINIFNISIGNFVCKVKWKISICVKVFIKLLQILPMTFHFVGDFISKKSA